MCVCAGVMNNSDVGTIYMCSHSKVKAFFCCCHEEWIDFFLSWIRGWNMNCAVFGIILLEFIYNARTLEWVGHSTPKRTLIDLKLSFFYINWKIFWPLKKVRYQSARIWAKINRIPLNGSQKPNSPPILTIKASRRTSFENNNIWELSIRYRPYSKVGQPNLLRNLTFQCSAHIIWKISSKTSFFSILFPKNICASWLVDENRRIHFDPL